MIAPAFRGAAGTRYKFNCGQPSGICQHRWGALSASATTGKAGVLSSAMAMVIVLVIAVRVVLVIILIAVREQGLLVFLHRSKCE